MSQFKASFAIVGIALALSACAGPTKHPAVFARNECQVEPQPLSCAGASDMGVMRAP